jgi:hypothetical protein
VIKNPPEDSSNDAGKEQAHNDEKEKPKVVSNSKQAVVILIITLVIISFPVGALISSEHLREDFSIVIGKIEENVRNGTLTVNFVLEGVYLSIQMLLIVISSALLFRVGGIKKDTLKTLEQRRLWRNFLAISSPRVITGSRLGVFMLAIF